MKGKIKKGDCIASMVFISIAFCVVCFSPEVIGAYVKSEGEMTVIPLFNLSGIKELGLLIRVIFMMGILKEALGIYWGRWTLRSASIYSALDIAGTVLTSILVLQPQFWNTNFITDVNKVMNKEYISMINANDFKKVLYGVIIISLVIASLEAASHIYKGYKYSDMNESVQH